MYKIKDWSSFQSYKDRNPPWIRLHRKLLDNFKFQKMSVDARSLLPMLWLLASEDDDPTSGIIKLNCEEIAFRLRQDSKIIQKTLDEILRNEFIEYLSIESASYESVTDSSRNCYPETETETETETEQKKQKKEKAIRSLSEFENHPLDGHYETWFQEKCPSINRHEKRDQIVRWCRAKGKTYKDYWSALQDWAIRDQKEKPEKKSNFKSGVNPNIAAMKGEL